MFSHVKMKKKPVFMIIPMIDIISSSSYFL